ncbi:MAG: bifunctional 2-polyprenyl-6-hydroxyphenol methylase/3-demethylubiquinol 3-O-methyltransferase UbiG [Geminicoccaceae bacterium]|nr:bifunctional 2-polyprenyl-6-hydroxyphenol methylase/3-demethylubiquinol 3-O-methyltransferase UbiG [Geminicoccaceae bacterium]
MPPYFWTMSANEPSRFAPGSNDLEPGSRLRAGDLVPAESSSSKVAFVADGRVDPEELAKFRALAERWWDPAGPLRALHRLNPARLAWLLERAHAQLPTRPGRRPLEGLRALDVGCGGGLVAEPLARLGAEVVAIDPEPANIAVAREHAEQTGLVIDYRATTLEDLLGTGERFDLVTALEVIEHVPDPAGFARALGRTLRPGGLLVLSTLGRTFASWVQAILTGEYLLGWLPIGTHRWEKFLQPSELARLLRSAGLRPVAITGLAYEPAYERFALRRDPSVNYMLAAVRDPARAA